MQVNSHLPHTALPGTITALYCLAWWPGCFFGIICQTQPNFRNFKTEKGGVMCLRISKGKVGASTNDRWLCPGKSYLASLKLDFPLMNGMG